MGSKLDTRAIGLDGGLHFIKWLTGAENLHYGFWKGLDPVAGNLRAAQDAYSDLLFSYLPEDRLRILDIGGGAGETARKLIEMGHAVEIVVPSPLLAARCRTNAPRAKVHECRFEEFSGKGPFDICLFSESFQYIPLEHSLPGALSVLEPGGEILLADCFRTEAWRSSMGAVVGGGHPWTKFTRTIDKLDLAILDERDITRDVAPSIDLEQGLFNVLGHVLQQVDGELAAKKRGARWILHRLIGLFVGKRQQAKLADRLMGNARNSEAFCTFNSYRIVRLGRG